MMRETRFGMTYGQLLSTITLLIIIIGSLVSWSNKFTAMNLKLEAYKTETDLKIQSLENGRATNAKAIEVGRIENNDAHQRLMDKMDFMIEKVSR